VLVVSAARRSVCRAATLLVLSAAIVAVAEVRAPEYEVKAAFLYNFAKFVEWPPGSERNTHAFRICLVGDDPFGALLTETVAGKTVQDRPIEIAHPDSAPELGRCQMAFIPRSQVRQLPRLLAGLTGASTLTVGETEDFARGGGMITFHIEENKVRFEINAEAAQRAGLRISSQLLKLATRVTQ